jgi:hypothetical protein
MKIKLIETGTFGDRNTLSMLPYIVDKLNENKSLIKPISKLIFSYSNLIKKLENVEDSEFKKHISNLLYLESKNRLISLKEKLELEDTLYQHLNNLLITKMKILNGGKITEKILRKRKIN